MLALHGFDAYGLDISATGVAEAEAFASKELQNPGAANFGPNHDGKENQSCGEVKFMQGDFFKPDWEKEVGGKFDLIYDYTVYSSLLPLILMRDKTENDSSSVPSTPPCAKTGLPGWRPCSTRMVSSLVSSSPCTRIANSLVHHGA